MRDSNNEVIKELYLTAEENENYSYLQISINKTEHSVHVYGKSRWNSTYDLNKTINY